MKRSTRGLSIYFILILGLLLLASWIGTLKNVGNGYTRGQFESALKNNEVAIVTIQPNKETPTGTLVITLSSGEKKCFITLG